MTTLLQQLFDNGGQSPWLDNLKRSYLTSGRLAELVGKGVRGLTSNPTIMAKAIAGSADYDDAFAECLRRGHSVEDAYWDLVIDDVTGALEVLSPVHSSSGGRDGFVSIEVSPQLAHDTDATIAAARGLHDRIARPNLLVKIPATQAGVPAIEQMIAEGTSINVTLIFSLDRYAAVIDAYQRGLERFAEAGGDPATVASVASFFVSRVDTETDRRLEELAKSTASPEGSEELLALRGKAAVAQARLAYGLYLERHSGARWQALSDKGARTQRPLWASTSTKNPAYDDLAYVDTLVAPDTVNTMPEETLELFSDHGTVQRFGPAELEQAKADFARLSAVGVDLDDVARVLERQGVESFADSFDDLLAKLADKAAALRDSR